MTVAAIQQPARKKLVVRDPNDLPDVLTMDYLIKGLIEPATLVVIYGESGSGKSFLALYILYLLNLGMKVFGRRVKQSAGLYVGLEGEAGVERRIAAIVKRHLPARPYLFNFITSPLNLFSGLGDNEALNDAIVELKAAVVVIDTFARAIGPGSENESADMGQMIEAFDVIRHETGAAVVIVHHAGKDRSRGMRGHSSLLAAADTAIEVERTEGGRTFKIVKSKDGVDGETFSFDLDVVELGIDQDGEKITSCVVREGQLIAKAGRTINLTRGETGWLKQLNALFAEPDLAQQVSPASGLTQRFCLTREQVREGLKKKGRFAMNPDGTLTGADREKMRAALNALQDKGKIGMTDKHVWLNPERQ